MKYRKEKNKQKAGSQTLVKLINLQLDRQSKKEISQITTLNESKETTIDLIELKRTIRVHHKQFIYQQVRNQQIIKNIQTKKQKRKSE